MRSKGKTLCGWRRTWRLVASAGATRRRCRRQRRGCGGWGPGRWSRVWGSARGGSGLWKMRRDRGTWAKRRWRIGAWWRDWLQRNCWPALGVAALWILTLLFRLSAPEAPPLAQTTVARSPDQIFRVLEADQRLMAWHLEKQGTSPAPARQPRAGQPRSEGLPARPAAQSGHGWGVDFAAGMMIANRTTGETACVPLSI